jgi:hypothetical protein
MQHVLYQSTMPLKDCQQVPLIEANEIEGKDSKDSEAQEKHYV